MAHDEIRHPAPAGEPWPVTGVRIRGTGRIPQAVSWGPAPHTMLEDVLLPCAWRTDGSCCAYEELPGSYGWNAPWPPPQSS